MAPLINRSSRSHAARRDGPVTRGDIEAKLRGLQADVGSEVEAAKPRILVAGAAVVVGLSVAFYLIGRRRGRKHSTVVEIRRV
ncbi:MAG: hypothetical protein ACYCS7_04330 [Acidimicrobiales bacterium]